MLANLLAVVVGLGSLSFYLVAFLLPEVHRRSDFFWSGVGMFYAVVLWYCARQMNGSILLGQTASVGLLLWLGYQTLLLRRETTPAAQQTPIRLGKAERVRLNGSRPIAKDYEFVEDGVEDALDQSPNPDSPVLIKPTADEFAPKMVVPAAIPSPSVEKDTPEELTTAETPVVSKVTQKREKPNPIVAVGILIGWVKDVVIPKPKETQPMIELPPRPPSISKSDMASTPQNQASDSDDSQQPTETSAPVDIAPSSTNSDTSLNFESTVKTFLESEIPLSTTTQQDVDDEDSNWPDDSF